MNDDERREPNFDNAKRLHLVMVMGLPGMGKTFTCMQLAYELGYRIISTVRLREKDKGRKGFAFTDKDLTSGYKMIVDEVGCALQNNENVIAESTFRQRSLRQDLYKLTEELDNLKVSVVRVQCEINVAKKRIEARKLRTELKNLAGEVMRPNIVDEYDKYYRDEPVEEDPAITQHRVGLIEYYTDDLKNPKTVVVSGDMRGDSDQRSAEFTTLIETFPLRALSD